MSVHQTPAWSSVRGIVYDPRTKTLRASVPLCQVYSYWGPRVVKNMYQGLSSSAADMGVGGAAIAAGMMSH